MHNAIQNNGCLGCDPRTVADVAAGLIAKPRNWLSIGTKRDAAVDRECGRWIGTPYREHCRVRGRSGSSGRCVGVGCEDLAAAVLDRLCRYPVPTVLPQVDHRASLHQRGAGVALIKAMCKAWEARLVDPRGDIEPGDIGVVRAENSAISTSQEPGHLLVAAGTPRRWLHVVEGPGVCWTALSAQPPLIALYRPARRLKERW